MTVLIDIATSSNSVVPEKILIVPLRTDNKIAGKPMTSNAVKETIKDAA